MNFHVVRRYLKVPFNISKSPVREAIQRLVQEELLIVKPKSGTFVTRLDSKNLIDMIKFRSILECGSLEIVILNNKCELLGNYLNDFIQKCRKDINDENMEHVLSSKRKAIISENGALTISLIKVINYLGIKIGADI
ncbi:hypothetical protein RG56_26100 (plasmid) [Escherichia coli]|nr:hypothetical protein RG56_26100 [Escherichia coli]APL31055.1 hypothetical protein RG61_25440 [Escherichia coli]